MLDDAEKYGEAEIECRQIIGLEQKAVGPENRLTLNSRGNLAVALIGQGKFEEAESEYRDVLQLMDRVLGLEHPDTLGYTAKFVTAFVASKQVCRGAGDCSTTARTRSESPGC